MLARMLGKAEVHAVAPVAASAAALDHPAPVVVAGPLAVPATAAAPQVAITPDPLGGPPAPRAAAHLAEPLPRAEPRGIPTALAAATRAGDVRLATGAGAVALVDRNASPHGARPLGTTSARESRVLRPGPPRRASPSPGGPLLTERRSRLAWKHIPHERLMTAWGRVVTENALPADELRLIGVFGPVPLGALDAVSLAPDGERALLRMRRTRVPGPSGDVALARHMPTGRLVSATIEAAAPRPPAGGARRPGHGRRRGS